MWVVWEGIKGGKAWVTHCWYVDGAESGEKDTLTVHFGLALGVQRAEKALQEILWVVLWMSCEQKGYFKSYFGGYFGCLAGRKGTSRATLGGILEVLQLRRGLNWNFGRVVCRLPSST